MPQAVNIIIFFVYAAGSVCATVLTALREFHMLQLNGYKMPEHMKWMRKNFRRYILFIIFLLLGILFLFIPECIYLLPVLFAADVIVCIINRPGKKYKKPLVYTARMKRMFVTFAIMTALFFVPAIIIFTRRINSPGEELLHSAQTACFLINTAVCLTPLIVPLSNIINRPVEKAIARYYINDAKKILKDMPNLRRIGITGSYGKTSMKFCLSELLSSRYETLRTPESFNTPMGVTITIRRDLKPTHQIFVCEMGARRTGEIKELCDIVDPHDGIITSVGPQHLETFRTQENVVRTKFELADSISPLGKIYLNGDNDLIREKAAEYKNAILYGTSDGCDYRASDISVSFRGTAFTVTTPDGDSCRFTTKLLGEHNVLNLTGAVAYCHGYGIPLEKLVLPVKRLEAVPHRLQLVDRGGDTIFIDDAYNSNPSGCRAALDVLGLFDECRILVTPGMVELGEKQEELNREFGREAAKVCDYIFLVGINRTKPIFAGVTESGFPRERVRAVDTLDEAVAEVGRISTDKKKIVLLENDLPDNY